jgi:hypothetical protein
LVFERSGSKIDANNPNKQRQFVEFIDFKGKELMVVG